MSGPTFPPSTPGIVWEQSSHVSLSLSSHEDASKGALSKSSSTVSLSSSSSPSSHAPSESLSAPSLDVSGVTPEKSVELFAEQSSHVSLSLSSQADGSKGSLSSPSKTVSLSSSVSPSSQRPSESLSSPSSFGVGP